MNLVAYPVFFSGDADRRLFSELAERGLGLAAGLRLAGQDCRVLVVTDDACAAGQAAALGVEVRRTSLGDDACLPGLPRGTQATARLLLAGEGALADQGTAVAVVDFRAPDVTGRVIEGILAEAGRQPGLWIGLSEADDHPVQFDIHLETVEAELHLYPDPEAEERLAVRASRSFQLALAGAVEAGPQVFLRLPPAGLGADFEPVSAAEALREAAGRGVVMECSAGGKGRRLLSRSAPWPQTALIPFGGCLDESRLLLVPVADGQDLDVHVQPLPPGVYRLSVFPVADGDVGGSPAGVSWLRVAGQSPVSVMAGGRAFTGALARTPAPPGDGLLVVLERQTAQGYAERTMALRMEEGGWDAADDLTRVILATGRQVMGRQDFPEVWELDGALLAVDAAGLAGLLTPDFAQGARGYPLGTRSSAGRAARLGLRMPDVEPCDAGQARG